jgi:hypothetical protein
MYVQRNTEARSPNHCCRRKNIKYYIFLCVCVCVCVCVCERARISASVCGTVGVGVDACAFARVALITQRSMRILHIVCGLCGFTTLFDIISQTTRFSEKLWNMKGMF